MQSTEQGLIVSKPELELLLRFTNPDSDQLNRVAFEAAGETIEAMATDGASAVRLVTANEFLPANRWLVELTFLEHLKRSMGAKDCARLEFSGESLTTATILEVMNDGDSEPVTEERATATWQHDACIHQLEFPFDGIVELVAPFTNDKGVPQSFSATMLKRMALLAKLDLETVTVTHGRRHTDGATWQGVMGDGTELLIRVMPYTTREKPQRRKRDNQPELGFDEESDE